MDRGTAVTARMMLVCSLVLAPLVAGCDWLGKKKGPSASSCGAPGASVACACVDGRTGAQVCGKDGAFGACQCSAAPTPPVTTPPAPTPTPPTPAPPSPVPAPTPAEERFDVVLTDAGPGKLNVVKIVKTVTGLGLSEAKAVVDGAPEVVKSGVSGDEAQGIKSQLVEAGATVELRPTPLTP